MLNLRSRQWTNPFGLDPEKTVPRGWLCVDDTKSCVCVCVFFNKPLGMTESFQFNYSVDSAKPNSFFGIFVGDCLIYFGCLVWDTTTYWRWLHRMLYAGLDSSFRTTCDWEFICVWIVNFWESVQKADVVSNCSPSSTILSWFWVRWADCIDRSLIRLECQTMWLGISGRTDMGRKLYQVVVMLVFSGNVQ